MIKNLKNKKKGFTLVELIVVIAILAILAAVALPKLGEVRKNAAWKSDIANAKTIANAVTIALAEETLIANDLSAPTVDELVSSGALQSAPKTQSTGYNENYTITVTDGNVKVFMTPSGTGTTPIELFPDVSDIPSN